MNIKNLISYYTKLNTSNTVKYNNINLSANINNITDNLTEVTTNTLFVAIKGNNVNAINFIPKAFTMGACICVVDDPSYIQDNTIIVDDCRKFLAILSYYFYKQYIPKNLFAVTGTNGKTSVTYFISQFLNLLQHSNLLIGTTGSYLNNKKINNSITTPKPTHLIEYFKMSAQQKVNYGILEASSHALHQHRLSGLNFVAVGFTNLTQDHLDYHNNMEEYFNTKNTLFTNYNFLAACINADDSYGIKILNNLINKTVLDYGYNAKYCKIIDIISTKYSQQVIVSIHNTEYKFTVNLLGKFMVYNVLCAMLMLVSCGFNFAHLCVLCNQLQSVNGRLNLIKVKLPNAHNANIFIDYAHTHNALENVLVTLQQLNSAKGNIIVIFGCGGNRDITKRPLMGNVANKYANLIVLTNDNPRHEDENNIIKNIMEGINNKEKVTVITDREQAIKYAISKLQANDILLIAGKGHEEEQILHNKTIKFNDKEIACKLLNKMGLHYEI